MERVDMSENHIGLCSIRRTDGSTNNQHSCVSPQHSHAGFNVEDFISKDTFKPSQPKRKESFIQKCLKHFNFL